MFVPLSLDVGAWQRIWHSFKGHAARYTSPYKTQHRCLHVDPLPATQVHVPAIISPSLLNSLADTSHIVLVAIDASTNVRASLVALCWRKLQLLVVTKDEQTQTSISVLSCTLAFYVPAQKQHSIWTFLKTYCVNVCVMGPYWKLLKTLLFAW